MYKDPSEIITVTFDFSDVAESVSNPVVEISVVSGRDDPSASAMLSGSPVISEMNVLQRVIGGNNGNHYKLRCQIDDADGERWVVADTLEVRTA